MISQLSSNRTIGLLALGVPFWFLGVYLVMSGIRPEYSHLTKAISELGSMDAPNRWVWNVCGYILPGMLIALLGVGLARQLRGERGIRLATAGLVASGVLMGLSGVFPGDFEDRTSLTMLMHTVGSLGSFVGFLVCGFALPRVLRRVPGWKVYAWPSLILVLLSIVTGLLRSGEAPGLGQRLGFACFFLWVGLIGFALFRNATPAAEEMD